MRLSDSRRRAGAAAGAERPPRAPPSAARLNTYGPTEATVVAWCLMTGEPPRHRAAAGRYWDLVVDGAGEGSPGRRERRVDHRRVGLARYSTRRRRGMPPCPLLGWERAYARATSSSTTPRACASSAGPDDQVKVGGRRIELGEITWRCSPCPGVRRRGRGACHGERFEASLAGYVTGRPIDARPRWRTWCATMPAALVCPRLPVASSADPHQRQDRPRRPALAVANRRAVRGASGLRLTAPRVHPGLWEQIIGAAPERLDDDFSISVAAA